MSWEFKRCSDELVKVFCLQLEIYKQRETEIITLYFYMMLVCTSQVCYADKENCDYGL